MYYAHSNATTTSPFLSSPPMHHLFTYQPSLSQLTNSELSHNNGNSSTSGSPSSLASQGLIQRSVSSHSLQKNGTHQHHNHPLSALFTDAPVRRVYSTGDLQRINGMQHNHHSDTPLSSESSMIIEGMSRACPYGPEEKKVRIERYRSKRNQRNFNKKIKYACRKTLADSRPRIRGRFARNDEIDKNVQVHWSHIGAGEGEYEEDENWVSVFDSLVAANLAQESQGSSSSGLLY